MKIRTMCSLREHFICGKALLNQINKSYTIFSVVRYIRAYMNRALLQNAEFEPQSKTLLMLVHLTLEIFRAFVYALQFCSLSKYRDLFVWEFECIFYFHELCVYYFVLFHSARRRTGSYLMLSSPYLSDANESD